MNAYDFVHLALLALGGKVSGRTNLQKKVYFLGIMTGCIDELGYRAHYYGPYSPEITAAIGQLEALGFVDSQSTTWGFDNRGFEMTKTDYTLNDDGLVIAEKKAEMYPGLWKQLRKAATALAAADDLDYVRLSIAAKAFFMISKEKTPVDATVLVQLAGDFGWKVSSVQIEEAVDYLHSLGLVDRAA